MSDEAYIVGRFQPLHLGHEDLIAYAREAYDEVTVITAEGRDQPSDRNPLSLDEREQLLDEVYSDAQDLNMDQLPGDNEGIHTGEDEVFSILDRYHGQPYDVTCITENPETIAALGDDYQIKAPPDTEYRDKPYRGGHVRELAAEGDDWTVGVSDQVADELDELGFEERMEELWD
ncbi:MAG: adenylyltransferase/cytidyltransferase family protein [Candidatus Nanohaloarchaea archaeon]|nr:adenylyltransferase/cytidyltransferase family protein [Candidatus Nanohaloarchaea archaeon]